MTAVGRRVSIVERSGTTIGSGTVTSTKQLVWNGAMLAEERNVSNVVTKEFFVLGEMISATRYYYSHDHLGSVREMTDSSGTIQARYDYDPYGRTTLVFGTNLSDFQYAGMYEHATSGLNLTWFRAYDPNRAKWLSRDPLGEGIALNLYAYVLNDPLNLTDFLGLCNGPAIAALGVSFASYIAGFSTALILIGMLSVAVDPLALAVLGVGLVVFTGIEFL